MVQIYRKKWERGVFKSLVGYLRDWLILILPVKRVPSWLVKRLYGSTFKFAFLVHPRTYQDIFISLPFFKFVKFFLPRQQGYRFFLKTSPFVLNTVKTTQGVNGVVIAHLSLPELMLKKRAKTQKKIEDTLRLVAKISGPATVVGLGGWFPMVTHRGMSLISKAKLLDLIVTNGHCGTLASIYMSVEKIAGIVHLKLEDVTLAIIGVGKMGSNVARAFGGKVKKLVLLDIQESSMKKLKDKFRNENISTEVNIYVSTPENSRDVKEALRECHIGICVTSSLRNLLRLRDLPDGFVAIDDSRPEALPRDPRNERIILEGGLLKIQGAKIDYNYGFGEDDNVFGCLGEAFLLALDRQMSLKPTLGDVDISNFFRLLQFCRSNNVTEGDFKSSVVDINKEDIRMAFSKRFKEIPYL